MYTTPGDGLPDLVVGSEGGTLDILWNRHILNASMALNFTREGGASLAGANASGTPIPTSLNPIPTALTLYPNP